VDASTDPHATCPPFELKDCALLAIATGRRAYSLTELRNTLAIIDTDSIYYHFWGGLLQPRFEEREYNNDFAGWVRHQLRDPTLAERLAVLDPSAWPDIEQLRIETIDLIEQRIEESEWLHWVRSIEPFEFIRSQIVVFDTHRTIDTPEALPQLMQHLSPSSLFYHFIDARRRLPGGRDDFRAWLDSFGERHALLAARLGELDPYFVPLTQLRDQLATLINEHFAGEPGP